MFLATSSSSTIPLCGGNPRALQEMKKGAERCRDLPTPTSWLAEWALTVKAFPTLLCSHVPCSGSLGEGSEVWAGVWGVGRGLASAQCLEPCPVPARPSGCTCLLTVRQVFGVGQDGLPKAREGQDPPMSTLPPAMTKPMSGHFPSGQGRGTCRQVDGGEELARVRSG